MEVLLVVSLLALPVTGLLAVAAPPTWMARRQCWPVLAVTLWVVALLLCAGWVVASYRAGVRADETRTGGNVFSTWEWPVGVALAALASLLVVRRTSMPSPQNN